MAVGAQGHCGIGGEASFGSGVTAMTYWQTFLSESLNITQNNIYSDRVQDVADQVGSNVGNVTVAGDISFPITPKTAPLWFQCALGQSSSPYYSQRPLKSFAMELDHETSALHASGCMVESMTLSSAQGGELQATVSIQAKGMSKTTAGSPVYSGDNPYTHQDAVFRLNDTENTYVNAWSITIANSLVTDLYGTSRERVDIPSGKLVVSGSITKLFNDVTERDAFLNCTVRSFWAKFSRESNYLTIWCPTVRYDTHTENITGQTEYIMETFGFTAYSDTPWNAATKSIKISGDFS